jgi:hypothetical protein
MTRRLGNALLLVLVCGVGVVASLGLILQFRTLPGPSIGMTLPLQATSHRDGASLTAIAAATLLLFGLMACVLPGRRGRIVIDAVARAVLACAWTIAIQAVSLQLTGQSTFGFDWSGAVRTPAPWWFAATALLATAGVGVASSNRLTRSTSADHLVDGGAAHVHATSIQA